MACSFAHELKKCHFFGIVSRGTRAIHFVVARQPVLRDLLRLSPLFTLRDGTFCHGHLNMQAFTHDCHTYLLRSLLLLALLLLLLLVREPPPKELLLRRKTGVRWETKRRLVLTMVEIAQAMSGMPKTMTCELRIR